MNTRRFTRLAAGFLAFSFAFSGISLFAQQEIPEDAVEFEGNYYKVYEDPDAELSWHEKKKKCEGLGGHLVVIETDKEQQFIAELADDEYLSLGATDEDEEGVWKWVNGAEWDYTSWMGGQPNNYDGAEHYLATYDEGQWVDVAAKGADFWMPVGYICEWEGEDKEEAEEEEEEQEKADE